MQLIRFILGRIILFFDRITSPRSMERSESDQLKVDQKAQQYRLYELPACPFCVKVRREIKRLGLNISRLNVKTDANAMEELMAQAGKYQVPCLRVDDGNGASKWIYESSDIIDLLRKEFSAV